MRRLLCGLSLVLLFACNEQAPEPQGSRNPNPVNWNTPMRSASEFTDEQMTIGKSICESFEIMRTNILVRGGSFTLAQFYGENKSCTQIGNSSSRATAKIQASRNSTLRLNVNASQKIDKDVLSDKHDRLERICNALKADQNTSDTIKDGANLRYQVNFYSTTDYEWLQIAEFRKKNGRFYPYLVEKAAIMTNYANVANDYIGMTKARTINLECSFSGQRAYRFQRWFN